MTLTGFFLVVLAALIGAAVGYVLAASRTAASTAATTARLQAEVEAAREARSEVDAHVAALRRQTLDQFRGLSTEALERATEQLLVVAEQRLGRATQVADSDLEKRQQAVAELVGPLREQLGAVASQVGELEKQRAAGAAALEQQIQQVRDAGEGLRKETASLVAALRRPQVRGSWGELHLRRSVEMAGLGDRVDFVEQVSAQSDDRRVRPDMVIRLVGDKQVVVDSKVPLEAFIDAYETDDEAVREQRLKAHSRHVRAHVDALAAKAYWRQFTPTPEFVVLFIPGESFLSAALQADTALLEYAFERQVIIATPTTLVGLLRTVAYAWTQESVARNAQRVLDLAKLLVERLDVLSGHLEKVGRSLESSVKAYNSAVGSYEARLLVTARELGDMSVTDSPLDGPQQVDTTPRVLARAQSPESSGPAEPHGANMSAVVA